MVIIHFGSDACFRTDILKGAGYSVVECLSIGELHSLLVGVREVGAVIIAENEKFEPDEAVSLTHSCSGVPLILFQSDRPHFAIRDFDFVVGSPAKPSEWLASVARLIALRAQPAGYYLG